MDSPKDLLSDSVAKINSMIFSANKIVGQTHPYRRASVG